MTRKNALFLLIDGMRFDVLADPDAAGRLVPNLARLAREGYVLRGVTNAQATQFVMPSLFSQTYPLDHGGYNDGLVDRPASFVERLEAAGYNTYMAASCNLLTPQTGYERGFAHMHTAADYRHIIEYRIDKTLRYHLDQWRDGAISDDEAVSRIAPDLDRVLIGIEEDIAGHGNDLWSGRLRRVNESVAAKVPGERALLDEDPLLVLRKLVTLPPVLYWHWMGERRVGRLSLFLRRAAESLRWRSRELAVRYDMPFFLLTHYQVIAGEVFRGLRRLFAGMTTPWYVHMHVMDLHDSFAQSRPLHALGKLRFLPRYLLARRAGVTDRHPLYDLSLCYVDAQLGRLLADLRRRGQLKDLIILVTADHGNFYAGSPRSKRDIAYRTNVEDIEVPVVVWGAGDAPAEPGLVDSMGVSASLLDLCGVTPHESFLGVSAYKGGRRAVISESAGGGNADLVNKDLYFTITTQRHRMMTALRGDSIEVLGLFDRVADPMELDDRRVDPAMAPVIDELLAYLWSERGALLTMRGARPSGDAAPAVAVG